MFLPWRVCAHPRGLGEEISIVMYLWSERVSSSETIQLRTSRNAAAELKVTSTTELPRAVANVGSAPLLST